MTILFVMASPEFLRFYDSTIRLLAERGHQVVVAVNQQKDLKPVRLQDLGMPERVSLLGVLPRRHDVWAPMAKLVRGSMDYVRFLHPRFSDAPVLRARLARKGLPPRLRAIDGKLGVCPDARVTSMLRALAVVERGIPTSRSIEKFIAAQRPDLVVVSPLVDVASEQVDVVRAARRRGVRVVAAIASWDNLTNKGLLRVEPDAILVWNEAQKREAVEMHGMAPERVVVTGAQLFDKWFDRVPSRSLDDFTRRVGLSPAARFILFTGSSMFISAPEAEVDFVKRWLAAIRSSADPALREAPVLIRPHPYNGWIWADVDVSSFGNVAVWPRGRYNPVEASNRDDYFDSLYYSRAVVGINTSAMVEASILERPVHSIVTADFATTQEGTLHFRHLLPENGGFLQVAHGLDAHLELLAASLGDEAGAREMSRRFVGWFLRPNGVDRACTPIVVEALERLANAPPHPPESAIGTAAARVLAVILLPAARFLMWRPSQDDSHPSLARRLGRLRRDAGKQLRQAAKATSKRMRRLRKDVRVKLRSAGVSRG